MFQELDSRTHSKGHHMGMVGFHATPTPTTNLTANSSPAFELLSLAIKSWRKKVTCVPYSSGWKEGGSRCLDTLLGVRTVLNQEAHGTQLGLPSKGRLK